MRADCWSIGKKVNNSNDSRSQNSLRSEVLCVNKSRQEQENTGNNRREIKEESNVQA